MKRRTSLILATVGLYVLGCCLFDKTTASAASQASRSFYLPHDSGCDLVQSSLESLRFTLTRTLRVEPGGHLVSISSFVNPEGEIMGWHDFGHLEGPGWAANAVGGAWEIYRAGRFFRKPEWQSNAVAIVDHVLECGFLEPSGFINGYRETTTGRFCLNYKHNSDWMCPGSMAKIGFQLLEFSYDLEPGARAEKMRNAAMRCAEWLQDKVEPTPNGWWPRRTTPEGKLFRKSPDGGNDPFWQTSADSLFILQLQMALTRRDLADYRDSIRARSRVFMHAGGMFGSINHDTYDPHENVAYSVAFRVLLSVSVLLGDKQVERFAFERCLAGLEQFKMAEDRNSVATRGLLYMEKSWDTSYLWENAEAALAYFEAAAKLRKSEPGRSAAYEGDGLVILRAAAKQHYGPHGFLTEGVDWNNHVGQQHHIGRARYAAIQYTEPFLNNQHIVEPTLFYLTQLARQVRKPGIVEFQDCEGNRLLQLSGADD